VNIRIAPLLLVVMMVVAAGAGAQSWPSRPVRVLVSSAAGGTPDIVARLVAERIGQLLGQQIVVDNKPGGANIIGAQAAARAPADGYNMFFVTAATLVTNPYTFKSLPYDPQHDFVPVAMVGKAPFMILVNSHVQAKTLRDLIALDKSDPGKLSVATDGRRNFSGMVAAWLNKLAGTQLQLIPYAAMPQGVQDTLADRTQVVILAVPSAAAFIKRGELRALAVTSDFRVPGYDDVPPVADTLAGFNFIGWFALVAPRGTPAAAIEGMNQAAGKALNAPDLANRLHDVGVIDQGAGTPDELGQFIERDRVAWGRVVKEIGITPE